MKMLIAIGMLAAGAAQAGVDNFTPNTGCTGTSCTAYINDNPGMTVTAVGVNGTPTVTVTMNGILYAGPGNFTQTLVSNPDLYHYYYLRHYNSNVLADSVGNTILLTVDVYFTRWRPVGGYWRTTYTVLSGTITQ